MRPRLWTIVYRLWSVVAISTQEEQLIMSDVLEHLWGIIEDRKAHPRSGSYTSSLFAAGENEILKKVGEEAIEVIVAAKGEGNERLIYETADLMYHLLVLLAARNLTWEDVEEELRRRFK